MGRIIPQIYRSGVLYGPCTFLEVVGLVVGLGMCLPLWAPGSPGPYTGPGWRPRAGQEKLFASQKVPGFQKTLGQSEQKSKIFAKIFLKKNF